VFYAETTDFNLRGKIKAMEGSVSNVAALNIMSDINNMNFMLFQSGRVSFYFDE
jgi:hypothetical protein